MRPSATMRATRSVGPPGGKPWSIVIGRSGQFGLARAGAAASIANGPAIAMRRVSSVTRVILRWLGVEQCRTLGVLREQTEFAAHTEFYSSEHARRLVEPSARTSDDLAPFGRIRADQLGELFRRATRRLIANHRKAILERLRCDRLVDRGVE